MEQNVGGKDIFALHEGVFSRHVCRKNYLTLLIHVFAFHATNGCINRSVRFFPFGLRSRVCQQGAWQTQ